MFNIFNYGSTSSRTTSNSCYGTTNNYSPLSSFNFGYNAWANTGSSLNNLISNFLNQLGGSGRTSTTGSNAPSANTPTTPSTNNSCSPTPNTPVTPTPTPNTPVSPKPTPDKFTGVVSNESVFAQVAGSDRTLQANELQAQITRYAGSDGKFTAAEFSGFANAMGITREAANRIFANHAVNGLLDGSLFTSAMTANNGAMNFDQFNAALLNLLNTCNPNANSTIGNQTPINNPNAQVNGDPHFKGAEGDEYNIKGDNGSVYNLLSDKGVQVNGLFENNFISKVGVTVGSDKVQFGLDGKLLINGQAVGDGIHANGAVTKSGNEVIVRTAEYRITINNHGTEMSTQFSSQNVAADGVMPHGLWGQTADGDGVARVGQDWDGTGVLERVNGGIAQAGDKTYQSYQVGNLFDTSFANFNRFNGASVAATSTPISASGTVTTL